jgi:hypothetical protein
VQAPDESSKNQQAKVWPRNPPIKFRIDFLIYGPKFGLKKPHHPGIAILCSNPAKSLDLVLFYVPFFSFWLFPFSLCCSPCGSSLPLLWIGEMLLSSIACRASIPLAFCVRVRLSSLILHIFHITTPSSAHHYAFTYTKVLLLFLILYFVTQFVILVC